MLAAGLAVLAVVAAAPLSSPPAASPPPAPTRWVEDHAGLISPAARDALDARLEAYERSTGHQVVVWIGTTLAGAPLDDWAVRTFAAWKLGRKGQDDGIAVFLFAADRAIDIEVGYGLEDKVPDATAARIIHDVMAPRLGAGDRDGAVTVGADAVLTAIEGHPWVGGQAGPPARSRDAAPSPLTLVLGVLGGLIVLIILVKHPRLALWLLWAMASGGRRDGNGSGSGGGFGGGGGRSGGGGARGGW
jgi:uncharacterized protein